MDYRIEEAVKRLAVNISQAEMVSKTLLITSVAGKEGKSFISEQLAKVYARKGEATLYIHGDMRSQVSVDPGLSEYLFGKNKLSEIVNKTDIEGYDIVLCGKQITTIINEVRFKQFIEEASSNYEHIIIDSPSVGEVADGITMGQYCDGVLLVLEPEIVEEKRMRTVKEEMERSGCKLLGVVMNKYGI